MTKLNPSLEASQEKPFSFANNPTKEDISNLIEHLPLIRKKHNQVFGRIVNYLIDLSKVVEVLYPSQEHIAKKIGCSRKQVNKVLGLLDRYRIISRQNNGFKKTCTYQVSPAFYSHLVRPRLVSILRSLVILPISLLSMSNPDPLQSLDGHIQEKVTLLSIKENLIDIYKEKLSKTMILKGIKVPYVYKKRFVGSVYMFEATTALKKLTVELNLTKWGQIKLSPFPEEALEYAIRYVDAILRADDPFNYLCSLLSRHCEQISIAPDRGREQALKNYYHMPDDAQMSLGWPKPKEKKKYGTEKVVQHNSNPSPVSDFEREYGKNKVRWCEDGTKSAEYWLDTILTLKGDPFYREMRYEHALDSLENNPQEYKKFMDSLEEMKTTTGYKDVKTLLARLKI